MTPKIIITTTSFAKFDAQPLRFLKGTGFEVVLNSYGRKLSGDEVVKLAADAVGLIAGTEPLDKAVLEKLPLLKVISRCGVGLDNVDLASAEKKGIKVFNTPYGPTLAVAELTVGLILNLLRKIAQMDRELRHSLWEKRTGNLLHGKKVGIIGFGRIGQKVSELLLPFGVEISYCDVCDISCNLPCSPQNIESLLSWADIILLHLSTPNEPLPLIGKKEIQKMKKGSWLINVSRGGIVDEQALYSALKNDHLAGATIDVFDKEPYDGPLSELENVILTPHIGSYAKEARVEMEMQAAKNLIKGLND